MSRKFPSLIMLILCATAAFADARSATWRAATELVQGYLDGAPPSAFKKAVAVLPIRVTGALERTGAADTVAAYLREKLSMSTVFLLVERANMDALLSEIELGLSGLADPASAAKAGELIGAELLVQGGLSEAGDRVLLSLELVDVSTGAVLSSVTGDMARGDLISEADAYVRSTFQSQFGLSLEGGVGTLFCLEPAWVPTDGFEAVVSGNPFMALYDFAASYKLLSFLSLSGGLIGMDSQQFYLSSDGRVESPLAVGDRTVRYSMFHGLGAEIGAEFALSPTPRLNLGLAASAFMLVDHGLTSWFMDFTCYEIDGSGTVGPMKRDIEVLGTRFDPQLGGRASLKAEYLISSRMSIGLDIGYLLMADYLPERFMVGGYFQSSSEDQPALSHIDKNGTWAFMDSFNVARVDGTTGSPYLSYNPSGLSATLSLAIHF